MKLTQKIANTIMQVIITNLGFDDSLLLLAMKAEKENDKTLALSLHNIIQNRKDLRS